VTSFTTGAVMTSRLEQRAEWKVANYEGLGQNKTLKMCKNVYLEEDLDLT